VTPTTTLADLRREAEVLRILAAYYREGAAAARASADRDRRALYELEQVRQIVAVGRAGGRVVAVVGDAGAAVQAGAILAAEPRGPDAMWWDAAAARPVGGVVEGGRIAALDLEPGIDPGPEPRPPAAPLDLGPSVALAPEPRPPPTPLMLSSPPPRPPGWRHLPEWQEERRVRAAIDW